MPRARTRMNEMRPLSAMFQKPDDGFDTFAPENVSPLVYENFCAAESKGSFFGKHIKGSDLKYRKIEPDFQIITEPNGAAINTTGSSTPAAE